MIRVVRCSCPLVLKGRASVGAKEAARARAFYGLEANATKSFKFNAYSEQSVKDALNKLFHYKCAYCESAYGATQPVDVEHFRPKGAVARRRGEKPQHPGYYWLAATWENLLPSCIDCNRAREHELSDGRRLLGKANLFPIKGKPAKPGRSLTAEKPLLLDPCRDDPQEHLRFDLNGWISPATTRRGESERGAESIAAYGLLRPGLLSQRQGVALRVRADIEQLWELNKAAAESPGNASLQQALRNQVATVKAHLLPSAPYQGMVRQLVAELLGPEFVP